uniref:Uroplakin 3B n=2 Tax=Anas platyrhynchos TaxID=8839 RepID=A0A493T1P3_ANAPP
MARCGPWRTPATSVPVLCAPPGGHPGVGNAPRGNGPDLFAAGPWLGAGMWVVGGHRRVPWGQTPRPPPAARTRRSAPSPCTMLPLLLLLLAAAHGLQELPYEPILTEHKMSGRITGSTFVLEQPRCAFDNVTAVGTATSIWLVVAEAAAPVSFPTSVQPGLPQWAFQNFPTNTSAYLTLEATILNYPCSKNPPEITVLRVGSESSCAKNSAVPTCNGPLPGPGPYKVKFLALNGTEPVAETQWSQPITLRTAQQPPSGPGAGGKRSAEMIAITSILSILLALLLAGLVATLAFSGSDPCGRGGVFKPEAASVRRYNTHHVYDQPAARL